MSEADFRIAYEGGEADNHVMDMRLLATSMLGAERIVSDGLIVLVHKRLPKRGERADVIVKAREPQSGSVELITFFGAALWALNLGLPSAKELAGNFISEWWKAILARFSGDEKASEKCVQALVKMNKDHLSARDASESRHHEETIAMLDVVRAVVSSQGRSIQHFVAPVGPSSTSATVYPALANPVRVGETEADTIREAAKLSWSDLEEIKLMTEGFRFHTSGLSIENPERQGYLMARVRDPRFREPVNPYTEAAQRRAEVTVLARKGRKDGVLTEIEIVDLIRSSG